MEKTTKKKQHDSSIKGWLRVWVAATILMIIISIKGNYSNPMGWILSLWLVIALIMVYSASGSRWYIVIVGVLAGAFFIYLAVNNNPGSVCLANKQICMSGKTLALQQMAVEAMAGDIVISSYLFISSAYFAFSKRVKARFGK